MDLNAHLSPHFTLGEMTVSQTASRRGLANVPGPAALAAMKLLCENLLEPVRAHYGRPVVVTSGYRSPAVNKACGGSPTSQHCLGEAADFTVPGVGNLELARWIRGNLDYDQLIYEFGESGWIHASWRPARRRSQELSAQRTGRGTVYLRGLVA